MWALHFFSFFEVAQQPSEIQGLSPPPLNNAFDLKTQSRSMWYYQLSRRTVINIRWTQLS